MSWLNAINIDALVKELLTLKANQEELTKRVKELEDRVYHRSLEPDPWQTSG